MRVSLLLMVAITLVGAGPEARATATVAAVATCVDGSGRTPVIEAGREREVRALFAPHAAGERLPPPAEDWTFDSIRVEGHEIVLVLLGPRDTRAEPRIGPGVCAPDGAARSASFYRGAAGEDVRPALDLLWDAAVAHDSGGFYRTFVEAPPPAAPDTGQAEAPALADAAESIPTRASRRFKGQPSSWLRTQAALALLLALGLLLGSIGLATHVRDMGLRGPGGRGAWIQLAAITALGGALRSLVPSTFLREAYPLPNVNYLVHGLDWGGDIAAYPQVQALLARGLSPVLAANPFDAWFQVNWLLGTVTIPAAWAAGAALTGSRRVAALGALLLACWPQHIRFTASESTHVGFVLGVFVVIALAAWSARSGRALTFTALVFATALAVVARPEGGLLLPGLAVLALGAGPGARDFYKRPAKALALLGAAALVVPTLLRIATSESASAFDPDAGTGEALSVGTLATLVGRLLWPSVHNAFFDLATCPPWLYLLALTGGVLAWRRGREAIFGRAALAGLVVMALTYFVLYAGMEPATTVWGMGRYHLSVLPMVVLLAAVGLDGIWEPLVQRTGQARAGLAASLAAALLGVAIWWPAITVLPLDWQTELDWLIERGRSAETRIALPSRLVLPDNRRRFRDLSPRAPIIALSGGEASEETAVTVAQAIALLEVPTAAPTFFLEGLYCHLAVDGDEAENPQCAAMKATFELEPVDEVTVDTPPFLVGYESTRKPAPFPLRLWRVVGRRLDAAAGLALLPQPIADGDPRAEASGVIASPTSAAMWPSEPPLR